jgi:death on curing protein
LPRGEPVWLDGATVIRINEREVAETGEPCVLLDEGKLASAVSRPRNAWLYADERDMASLAAKLLVGIAMAHPFAQGNKRTAATASIMFVQENGLTLPPVWDEAFAWEVLRVIAHETTEDELAAWLRDRLVEIED